MILFAYGVGRWSGVAASGAVHGLKVVAVAVVAQALWGMSRSLCPDRPRAGIAVLAALAVLVVPTAAAQVAAIALGGLLAGWLVRPEAVASTSHCACGVSRRVGGLLLLAFAALLVALPTLGFAGGSPLWSALAVFYQSGALVFGGGHVVLPLLQAGVVPPGWVDADTFLAGYGAAQAVPGPLFTFAAFLGAAMPAPLGGWTGGLLALAAIFVPAWLLVVGALPFWEAIRRDARARRAMAGANAAVVGVLGAALYDPVWTSAIHSRADFGLALAAFALLVHARVSPVLVVVAGALAGWAMA
jgi:chromate transporter